MRKIETTYKKQSLYEFEDLTKEEINKALSEKVYENFYIYNEIISLNEYESLDEKEYSSYDDYLKTLISSGFRFTSHISNEEKESFINSLMNEVKEKNLTSHSIRLREFLNDEKLYMINKTVVIVNELKFMEPEKIKESVIIRQRLNNGETLISAETYYNTVKNEVRIIELAEMSDKKASDIYFDTCENEINLESYLNLK